MTPDPINEAIAADAAEAREQVRAHGITCPSCGQNMADLSGTGHGLAYSHGDLPATLAAGGTVQCPGGQVVDLHEHLVAEAVTRYSRIRDLASFEVLHSYERHWRRLMDEMIIGPPRTEPFAGFLWVLRQDVPAASASCGGYIPIEDSR